MQPHMQAKQNRTLMRSKRFLFFIIPPGFFFLINYCSAVCMAFKIFRFSPNQFIDIKRLNTLVLCKGVYIGNDNVEDDESPS